LVHGFATLWLTGALPAGLGEDPETAARAVAGILFGARDRLPLHSAETRTHILPK
nr:TetR family transcriptional regulator [Actinomycetota bacterium]